MKPKFNFIFLLFLSTVYCLPSTAFAQFIGYSTPQTAQQTLATNTACTGVSQPLTVKNIGQTQHTFIIPNISTTHFEAWIEGSNDGVNFQRISDQMDVSGSSANDIIGGSGYFPIVRLNLNCQPASTGTFSVVYSGTSVTPQLITGDFLKTAIDKQVLAGAANSGGSSQSFGIRAPFGSTSGQLLVTYTGAAGPAGSTIQINCSYEVITPSTLTTLNLATTQNLVQTFTIPPSICPTVSVAYSAGGASTSALNLEYLFQQPGTPSYPATSASALSASLNIGAQITEKGPRWSVISSPGAGVKASASQAAGAAGVRHVADCLTVSAGTSTAPTATILTINLRDGASGAGTILWQTQIAAAATAAQHGNLAVCGLNLIGTAATAMTLEFGALLTNENESVTLTGYDVQ